MLDQISSMMSKSDGVWKCTECDYNSSIKTRLWEHVEAIHVKTAGYECHICHKVSPSYSAFKMHKSRKHRN